ncbi:hypothetical protein EV188_104592 [Actinomycetospora succinea]|uniref:Uncharacterized protein n=1 Tax=Actinomycetospora succinea TaxID=663603 RepID=A0A4R6VB47_9PSEU|nr:hypothetical protein [Actinomycetospora succinea]TDQ58845.1 hypothetical protein EV188_104592 [Actinomycetospora succinea]
MTEPVIALHPGSRAGLRPLFALAAFVPAHRDRVWLDLDLRACSNRA